MSNIFYEYLYTVAFLCPIQKFTIANTITFLFEYNNGTKRGHWKPLIYNWDPSNATSCVHWFILHAVTALHVAGYHTYTYCAHNRRWDLLKLHPVHLCRASSWINCSLPDVSIFGLGLTTAVKMGTSHPGKHNHWYSIIVMMTTSMKADRFERRMQSVVFCTRRPLQSLTYGAVSR